MPLAVHLLGLAVFAQGTSEFMLSGLLPDIARDLRVSIPAAGALTSAFAVGMIVGAPLMAALTLRLPRRRALLIFLLVFMTVHVVGALTTSFTVLLVSRVVGALANAGFLAVGMATATSMVRPDAKGRAISVLLSGVTLACVAGVPGGAVLGQVWSWRSAFWAVALVCVPVVFAVMRWVPGPAPVREAAGAEAPGARRELRALRRARLRVILLLAAVVNAATFCTFTYLAPVVTQVGGLAAGWVPVVLALFGLGAFAGVSLGGRMADDRPLHLLLPGGVALALGWALFALTAGNSVAVPALVVVQGALSFAVGSTLITQSVYAAPEAPTLGGSFATAALNAGAALGPVVGGAAIEAGLGYRSPLWVSAGLVAGAFVVGGIARAADRAHHTKR